MNVEGCWSTVVCTSAERSRLGLTGTSDWLLRCRLPAGHVGNHASDASEHPRLDRRLWLEWNDFDDHAQSLIERNPCSARALQGAACRYFEGHGGPHVFAPSNGHAPAARPRPQGSTAPAAPQSSGRTGPAPRPTTTATRQAAPNAQRPPAQPKPPEGGRHDGGRHEGDQRHGRRTAATPVAGPPRPGSRHRLPEPEDTTSPGDGADAAVAAALRDVAAALDRLAVAIGQVRDRPRP